MAMDWTKVLGELGLESPGYHECVARCTEATAQRKKAEAARMLAKGKRKKKR